MRLKSLVTTSFKKLGDASIEFAAGLNILAGANAKGKSTVLQAIEVALFGVSVVPGKKEDIPTWGQQKFSITLKFELPCGLYRIVRTMATAKMVRLGETEELVANGNTPVTAMVEQLLGLTAKDYSLFVQSRQGETSGILTFGATALNRKVEEFAGVAMIDKVQAAAQKAANLYSAYAEAKLVPQEDLDAAIAEEQSCAAAATQAENVVECTEKRVNEHPAFVHAKPEVPAGILRDKADAARTLLAKLENAESGEAMANTKVAEQKARLADMKAPADGTALKEKQAQLEQEGTKHGAELKRLQSLQATRAAAQKVYDDIAADDTYDDVDFEDVERELVQAQDVIKTDDEAIARESEVVAQARVKVNNLKTLADGAACPTCGHAKEGHDPVKLADELKEAQDWLKNREAYVKQLQEGKEPVLARIKILNQLIEGGNQYQIKFNNANAALEALELVDASQITDVETAYNQTRTAYAEVAAELRVLSTYTLSYNKEVELLSQTEEFAARFHSDAAALAKQYDELPEPPTAEDIKAAEDLQAAYDVAYTAWRDQDSALKASLLTAQTELRHRREVYKNAEGWLDGLQDRARQALEDEKTSKKYARLVQFLRERRQSYLKEVWDVILGVSSRLVNQASSGLITRIDNIDGTFYYEEDGILAPTTSASGAQKAFIGAMLRIGLARALYGSDSLLAFDEPSESMNEANAQGLAAALATSAKQVLLITHRETDQSLAAHIIEVGA